MGCSGGLQAGMCPPKGGLYSEHFAQLPVSRPEFFDAVVTGDQGRGEAWGVRAGTSYVDVGTLDGYRQAMTLLASGQARRPMPELRMSPNPAVAETSPSCAESLTPT